MGLSGVVFFVFLVASHLCLAASYGASSSVAIERRGHFRVQYSGAENVIAGHLISIVLEEAYIKIGADLLYWPKDKIGAELYPEKEFFDITRSPSWVGGLYDGKIKLPAGGLVERTGELERVLFHEYTHAIVYRLSRGRAPAWLNEGLAQYEEGRRRPGFAMELKVFMRDGGMPLSSLERSFFTMSPGKAAKAYALSLSVTGYIIDEFGYASLKRILAALGQGHDLDSAIRASIFLSYEALEDSWRAWALR